MKKVRSFFVLTVIFACAICPVHRVTANEEMGSVKQRLEKIRPVRRIYSITMVIYGRNFQLCFSLNRCKDATTTNNRLISELVLINVIRSN